MASRSTFPWGSVEAIRAGRNKGVRSWSPIRRRSISWPSPLSICAVRLGRRPCRHDESRFRERPGGKRPARSRGKDRAERDARPGARRRCGAAASFLQPSEKPGSLGRLAHYEVLDVLGNGGFGTVVKAFDEKLHRFVAIKLMSPLLAATSAPASGFCVKADGGGRPPRECNRHRCGRRPADPLPGHGSYRRANLAAEARRDRS